jgi:hypothetical protein
MRGVDQSGLRPGLYGPLRLLRRNLGPLQCDSGNDGNLSVDRFDEAFDDRNLLVGRQKGPFSRMAENDRALDAGEAAEPGAETLDRRVVHFALAGERGHGRGDKTSEIKCFHRFLQWDRCARIVRGDGEHRADRVRRTYASQLISEDSGRIFQLY